MCAQSADGQKKGMNVVQNKSITIDAVLHMCNSITNTTKFIYPIKTSMNNAQITMPTVYSTCLYSDR